MRSYVEATKSLGFNDETARTLVLDMIAGTIETARRSLDTLEELRTSVTSKNGTTQAGLAKLRRDRKIEALFRNTTQATYKRAIELR